jgi:CelD/BcsL family acetyltransferase involved in cellulose biosynthesis
MLKSAFGTVSNGHAESHALSAVPVSVSVTNTLKGLRELEAPWKALEASTANRNTVFQSFDWCMAWAETYVAPTDGVTLQVMTGWDNGQLVFVWPLMRTRSFGFAVLTWLTDPFGQYGDILVRKDHNPGKWLEAAITFLKRLKDVDILRLRHVRADSTLLQHGSKLLSSGNAPDAAPFLDLTQFDNEEQYDARYTPVQRKRRKKIRKAIEDRLGPVSFQRLDAGTISASAMQQAFFEKNLWLTERGRMNRVMGCPKHVDFLANLSKRGTTAALVVSEMRAGATPVSWEIGFRHQGRHYGYVTSHVNALTDLSPGRLHMDLSQRACLADGATSFDLMVPNDTHKESWSSGKVATNDYYLPLSYAGHALGYGFVGFLRPHLRNLYYKLDTSTLRRLNLKAKVRGLFRSSKGL